jgi:hypothetical protein
MQYDPEGDALSDAVVTINNCLVCICTGIEQLVAQSGGGGTDPTCCAQVVAQLTQLATQTASVAAGVNAIAGNVGTTIDLSPVTTALNAIADATAKIQPATGADITALADKVQAVADAISNGPNTKAISDALEKANEMRDIPHPLIKTMLDQGALPPEMSALLQGTPADWVHAALGYAALISPPIAILEHLLGDDKDYTAATRKAREAVNILIGKYAASVKAMKGVGDAGVSGDLRDLFSATLTLEDKLLFPMVSPLIAALKAQLSPPANASITIGNIGVDPDGPVSAAAGVALTAALAAWLLSYAGIDQGESLTKMAEYAAGLVGFEELKDVEIGPLIRNGIAKVAELQAKAQFRQDVPAAGAVYELAARGLVPRSFADALAAYNGLPAVLENPTAQAAYSGLNPRILMRLIDTGLFAADEISDELTFSGLRPQSQARLVRAAPYMATDPERKAYRAAVEAAYKFGFFDNATASSLLDSAEHNVSRNDLILERLALEVRTETAKGLENEYSTMYAAGLIDDATYRANLAGLGLQDWRISTLMAVQEGKAAARLARQEAAAARALVRATAAEERRAAVRAYLQGATDEAGLSAALVLTGLTPIQAAAWVELASLQKAGSPRWVFGLRLPPEKAVLLQDRIRALTDQFKKQLISKSQFVDALTALGLDAQYINALLAAAAAMLSKSGAFLVDVQTQ